MLKKARYLLSTLSEFPVLKSPQGKVLPEIALAGRSNVGKSSLINHLLNQGKLAKTSATPGKTQLINFYSVGDEWLLVDLPGYGFAKAPSEAVAEWSRAIDAYLNERQSLKLLLLLVDGRRNLESEELSMLEWAKRRGIALLLVMTKTDKLKTSEKEAQLQKLKHASQVEVLPYSVHEPFSRTLLMKRIEKILWD